MVFLPLLLLLVPLSSLAAPPSCELCPPPTTCVGSTEKVVSCECAPGDMKVATAALPMPTSEGLLQLLNQLHYFLNHTFVITDTHFSASWNESAEADYSIDISDCYTASDDSDSFHKKMFHIAQKFKELSADNSSFIPLIICIVVVFVVLCAIVAYLVFLRRTKKVSAAGSNESVAYNASNDEKSAGAMITFENPTFSGENPTFSL